MTMPYSTHPPQNAECIYLELLVWEVTHDDDIFHPPQNAECIYLELLVWEVTHDDIFHPPQNAACVYLERLVWEVTHDADIFHPPQNTECVYLELLVREVAHDDDNVIFVPQAQFKSHHILRPPVHVTQNEVTQHECLNLMAVTKLYEQQIYLYIQMLNVEHGLQTDAANSKRVNQNLSYCLLECESLIAPSNLIIIIQICKSPTLWLKTLNKYNTHNVHQDGNCYQHFNKN